MPKGISIEQFCSRNKVPYNIFYKWYNNSSLNFNKMINALIHTAVRIIIGWLLIERVPAWLNIRGIVATILKVIGVLIIISALLDWI